MNTLNWDNREYMTRAFIREKNIECQVAHIGQDRKVNIVAYAVYKDNYTTLKRGTVENLDNNRAIQLAKEECQKFIDNL